MIIIIDFDGTIVENAWPDVGALRLNAAKVIRKLHGDGNTILIDTCRCAQYEAAARVKLDEAMIPFDYMNCNHPDVIKRFGMDSRKISGDVRIDDLNLGGIPDDWEDIYEQLQKHPLYGTQDN